jgi:hypothetical protein
MDSSRRIGNRKYRIPADAGLGTSLTKQFHSTIHVTAATKLIKIPDAIRGFDSDLGRIDMCVDINDLHRFASNNKIISL